MNSHHVRALTDQEGDKLRRIVRQGNGAVSTWQHAHILLYAEQGLEPPHIAPLAFTTEARVTTVIDNFNREGLAALYRP